MISYVFYRDLYVPVLRVNRNFLVAKMASYWIFKRRVLTFEELHAAVSGEFDGATSPRLKHFLHSYVKKLQAYGLVEVKQLEGVKSNHGADKLLIAKADAIPLRWLLYGLLNDPYVRSLVSDRTIKAWRRGETHPDLKRLFAEVVA